MMILAWIRLIVLLLWVLTGGAIVAVLYYLRLMKLRDGFMRWGYGIFLKIARVRVTVKGSLSDKRPLLLVSNHISYMDIPILAASANVRFTPKSEIAGWPVIGFFCKVQDCIFIDRRVSSTARNKKALEQILQKGEVVSLFPEGTTGNGKQVLPFRSSYFSLCEQAEGTVVSVQPATIRYVTVNGLPVDSVHMPRIAWYGDMYLLPHVLEFLSLGRMTAELVFHDAVTLAQFDSRKEMASYCHDRVAGVKLL